MNSPFKFLESYSKEDKDIFFGRDKEVEEIYARLFKSSLLLVYGASGTGKTSILNCGIANKFAETDWYPLHVRRRNDINTSIRQEVLRLAHTPIPEAAGLNDALHSLYLDNFKPIYLIFDQFEELFISGGADEQKLFMDFLSELLERGENIKVIILIREEYLAYFNSFEEKIPSFFENRYRVEHMTARKAEDEVIVKTCNKAGIGLDSPRRVSDEIIRNISSSTSSRSVELSYLQVYLDRLFRHYLKTNPEPVIFSFALVKEVGSIDDVLALFLEEQISQLDSPGTAWNILKAFITSGGTKRTTSFNMVKEYLKDSGLSISDLQIKEYLEKFLHLKIIKYLDEQQSVL